MRRLWLLTSLPALILSASSVGLAADYYVDQGHADADDSNPGTESEPWLTVQHAADSVAAGDTVWVKAGTYREEVIVPSSGAPGALITFRAMPGDAVVIDAEGTRSSTFRLDGQDYIRIEGFGLVNAAGHGILVGWSDATGFGIEIVGNSIHGGGQGSLDTAGVYYRFARAGLIEDNEIFENGGDGITMQVTDGITIRGNHIHHNEVDGIKGGGAGLILIEQNSIHDHVSGLNHGDGLQCMGGSDTVIVRDNLFYDATQNIYFDTYDPTPGSSPWGRIFIVNNVVINTQTGPTGDEGFYNGISIDTRYNRIAEVHVIGNTLVGLNAGHGGLGSADPEYGVGLVRAMNNVFYNSTNSAGGADTVELDYNLYYNDARDWYLPGYLDLDAYRLENPAHEVHGLEVDPLFVDLAERDFHLTSGSLAIDLGSAIDALDGVAFDTDHDGTARPQGSGWDIGAFEYCEGGCVGAGGVGGSGGSSATGGAGATTSGGSGGGSTDGGDGPGAQPGPAEEDGGCGCRVAGSDPNAGGWVVGFVAVGLYAGRRRPRKQSPGGEPARQRVSSGQGMNCCDRIASAKR